MLLRLLALLSIVLMLWPDPEVHSFPAVLAFFLVAAWLGLQKLWRHNLPLWKQLRGSGRPIPKLLRDALVLWSPLGLVIVVLAVVASLMSAGVISLAYRLTTLDEYCKVASLPGDVVVPCTGMDGVLQPGSMRAVGVAADLDFLLHEKYRASRLQIVALGESQLREGTANRAAFLASLSPIRQLGLEASPDEDPGLLRMTQELRLLVASPVKPAGGVLDLVRYLAERDAHITRMRELTARVLARREQVRRDAYDDLSPAQLHPLRFGHRVAHVLAAVPMRLDANADRAAVVRVLAENESEVSERLREEFKTPVEWAALAVTLRLPRHCTVATTDPYLRLRESDFDSDDSGGLLESNGGSFACFNVPAWATPLRLESLGLRESVRRSIDRWHEGMAVAAAPRLGRLSRALRVGGVDTAMVSQELGTLIPAQIRLGRQQCGWTHPGRCLMNSARESLEDGYAQARSGLGQALQSGAEASAASAGAAVGQDIGVALLDLDGRLDSLRVHAHDYADDLFWSHDLLQLLGWMALALIAIKSFLYVLALELFHSDEQMTIRFEGAEPIEGSYCSGPQLAVDRSFRTPLITRKQLSNADNHLVLAPWPWASPLARLFRRRYFFFTRGSLLEDGDRKAVAGDVARGMVASASGGQSIVEWTLREGEQVIFRYQDFYGASENVSLQSELSLRLSTLLFGRVVFHSARCLHGEGRLLLKASVEAVDQAHIRAVPLDRMIAWNRHAQFTVHSGRTPWKTLVNGFTLVRRDRPDGHHGLIVVSSEDTGASTGSLRYLKRIFSSIF